MRPLLVNFYFPGNKIHSICICENSTSRTEYRFKKQVFFISYSHDNLLSILLYLPPPLPLPLIAMPPTCCVPPSLDRPYITASIMGATNVDQIDQNVGALDKKIPIELLKEMETVSTDGKRARPLSSKRRNNERKAFKAESKLK